MGRTPSLAVTSPHSSVRQPGGRLGRNGLSILTLATALLMAGCGAGALGGQQPAGASGAAASGSLADVPTIPAAAPLGPARADGGTFSRRLRVPNITPDKVMVSFDKALAGWSVAKPTTSSGPGTLVASWTKDDLHPGRQGRTGTRVGGALGHRLHGQPRRPLGRRLIEATTRACALRKRR